MSYLVGVAALTSSPHKADLERTKIRCLPDEDSTRRKLKTHEGGSISLDDYRGKSSVVLFFYPKVWVLQTYFGSLWRLTFQNLKCLTLFILGVGIYTRMHKGGMQIPG